MVKMMKCRQMCTRGTPQMSREGVVQIPPQTPRQAATGVCSSSGLSAVFSTVSFLSGLHLIMTETVFLSRTSNEA